MKRHNKELVIMHPGPINRGVELDGEVADSDQAIILDQVLNGVAIIGDILHSRVALSNIFGLIKLGAKIMICAPRHLVQRDILELGVKINYNVDEVIDNLQKKLISGNLSVPDGLKRESFVDD